MYVPLPKKELPVLTEEDLTEIELNFVLLYRSRRPRVYSIPCSQDGCLSEFVTSDRITPLTTYKCQEHTNELGRRTDFLARRFGVIRPGPFEYHPRPTSFEYFLYYGISPEEANRAHTRQLYRKLKDRSSETLDRDEQFSQFERGMRPARDLKTYEEKRPRRSDCHRHVDDPPDYVQRYSSKTLLSKFRVCSEWGKGGLVYEFPIGDSKECEAYRELTEAMWKSLIVPFRPDSFEGRAISITSGSYRKNTCEMKHVLPAQEPLDERINTLETLENTTGAHSLVGRVQLFSFNDYWYARAARGELRYKTDRVEDLIAIKDKDGKRSPVLVNLNHHLTQQVMRMFDEMYGSGSEQFNDKSDKEKEAMRTKDRRAIERMKNDRIDFSSWSIDELLEVWRERGAWLVIKAGRQTKVVHLKFDQYSGLATGLGGTRADMIEINAQNAIDAEFERRLDRAVKDAKGEEAKHVAFAQAVRENLGADTFSVDFGGPAATPETAPDELWHVARAITDKLSDEPLGKHPEIKAIFSFYPDLLDC